MKKRIAMVIMLAIVSMPNLSAYKAAVSALGKLQSSGVKIETGYKPTVPPASEVYDPENPIYGGRDFNY